MADYTVTFARSAHKDLKGIPFEMAERIVARIEKLAHQPRPSGSLKLKGEEKLWRIRIGDYRVIYEIDDTAKVVDITVIRHRKDVYRDF